MSKVVYWLHLTWKSGFLVGGQEGEVNNVFLNAISRKAKSVTNQPQSRCEAELVSKEEEIGQQLHDVSIEE